MEFVAQAGLDRENANKHKHDIADYDHSRFNLTGLQANRLGVAAEAAAFKWLGGNVLEHDLNDWAHYVPNTHPNYEQLVKKNADLFNNVEVRRANAPGSPIPIRSKDRKPGRFVLQVYVPYVQLERFGPIVPDREHIKITGWAKASDRGSRPAWADPFDTSEVVARRNLWDFPVMGLAA